MSKRTLLVIAAAIALTAGVGWGASPRDAERLGKDLTPAGAERAGNRDGTIPAWEGKDEPLPGWSYGKLRGEFWKHKGEKPLFSIDASNVDKHSDKLSPGQVQFIKQTKGYRMDVYPTHRNAGFPDWVEANIRKNATGAKLAADGMTLEEASLPGVPFPIPASGAEAIWNHLLRYQGVGIEWPQAFTGVSPRAGSSEGIDVWGPTLFYYPWGKKGSNTPKQVKQTYLSVYYTYTTPPALAGQAIIQNFWFGKDAEAFYYFPGQRRVRRLPTYAYDSPQIGFENQYTIDQTGIFQGNPDRFDWKIVGKKELYVPYNSFGMYNFKGKLHDTLLPQFVNPSHLRYELHRVWVLEATVKKGMRHTAPKKVFYLDEDSWIALLREDYDARGALWKLAEGHPIPVWELGSVNMTGLVQYDLLNGRYVSDTSSLGAGKDMRWFAEATDPRFKPDFFTAENLRALSER